MAEPKFILYSKTFWGALVAATPAVVEAANYIAAAPFISPHVAAVDGGIGVAFTMLGRFVAKGPLSLLP